MEIIQHRKPLSAIWQKLSLGKLSVGFIGGSITDGRPRNNWPEPVATWLANQFPNASIVVENAAIGATGSDLAVFRAQRDLIGRGCDVVFVEYAVNDSLTPTEKRTRTREGLLRKLLRDGQTEVVLVYTFSQPMYAAMMEERVPDTISEFEKLAEHYNISSVWMGMHALNEIKQGIFRWEEWLPDGIHPSTRGSLSYAQAVIQFLEQERALSKKTSDSSSSLPPAMNALCWENTRFINLDDVSFHGSWITRRWLHHPWLDQIADTSSVGARLSFTFEGRGLALGLDFGRNSAEFRYRIDDQPWKLSERHRESWLPSEGLLTLYLVNDELEKKNYRFELEVIHGDQKDCTGTNFRLGFVGIID